MWRNRIAEMTVGYFDSKVDKAEGEQEKYLFNQVNLDWAYAEFATEVYGHLVGLMADEGLSIEQAMDKIDEKYLEETFELACQSAEGL